MQNTLKIIEEMRQPVVRYYNIELNKNCPAIQFIDISKKEMQELEDRLLHRINRKSQSLPIETTEV